MSVHLCQAADVCILLSLRSSWACKPPSSSDPAMSNYLSSTSFNHAGILHGTAVLHLLLLELNTPYGLHLEKGWSCKVRVVPAAKCRLCAGWHLPARLRVLRPGPKMAWLLGGLCSAGGRVRGSGCLRDRRSVCADLVLRCSGLPRLKVESLLAKIIPAKWHFKGGENCKVAGRYWCV